MRSMHFPQPCILSKGSIIPARGKLWFLGIKKTSDVRYSWFVAFLKATVFNQIHVMPVTSKFQGEGDVWGWGRED